MGQGCTVTCHQRVDVLLQPIEKGHVGDGPVLDDFGQAGAELARRQGAEHVQIAHHPLWLVKGANHVLAQRVVDGRLATHRRVHLGQQGRGHLHERHAAHVAGRSKARHVAHHAAAKGEQHGLAVAAVRQQGIKNQLQGLPVLVRFAIGELYLMDLRETPRQRRAQGCGVQRGNRGVAHDQRSAGTGQTVVGGGVSQQATANGDAIATLAQVDGDFLGNLGHEGVY